MTLLVGVSAISVTLLCGLLEAAVPPDSRRVPYGVGDTSAIVVSEIAASWVDCRVVTENKSYLTEVWIVEADAKPSTISNFGEKKCTHR